MRRFLLLVFVVCAGASAAFSLWPRQLGGYLALFGQHTSVNSGVAVTVVAVLTMLLVAVRVRLCARAGPGPAAPRADPAGGPGGLPHHAGVPGLPGLVLGARPLR